MITKHQNSNGILSLKWAVITAIALLSISFVIASLTEQLAASYSEDTQIIQVEIDGISFGNFNKINNIKDLTSSMDSRFGDYTVITLNRDFVADPSLYQWAKKTVYDREGLKDIHLVTRTPQGEEVSRYVLKLCRPLSWSLEAADPTLGGFHEKVKIAVQEIAIY
ncbi:MAG: hypothetical protein R3B45_01955 [Bdellovibrionota bacterium]